MELLTRAPLLLDLGAETEVDALVQVARLLEGHAGVRDHAGLVREVLARQRLLPPLLGNGVALPHARTSCVEAMVFAIGRCRSAVPFGPDGEEVRLIFLYGVPPGEVAVSLGVVAGLARTLRRPEIVRGLLDAPDDAAFRRCLALEKS